MNIKVSRLNLISPLYYTPEENSDPFAYREDDGEKLFCFELNRAQAQEFEPDKREFLREMIFAGKAAEGDGGQALPPGNYLFAQRRELVCRAGIVDMAVEIQQEGLWQRLSLGGTLYLRRLFEDGCSVTQVLRPYTEPKTESFAAPLP